MNVYWNNKNIKHNAISIAAREQRTDRAEVPLALVKEDIADADSCTG